MKNYPYELEQPRPDLIGFLKVIEDMIERQLQKLGIHDISDVDDTKQQEIVDRINGYIAFEAPYYRITSGVGIRVEGHGLLLVANSSGGVLGGEVISGDDVVTGTLDEICVLTVPCYDSVQCADSEKTPILRQVLSPIVLLENVRYGTGGLTKEGFQIEHDLSNFVIGIPTNHRLSLSLITS